MLCIVIVCVCEIKKEKQQQQLFGPEIKYSYRNIKNKLKECGSWLANCTPFCFTNQWFYHVRCKTMDIYLSCKQRQLYRPVNHRGFRETAPGLLASLPVACSQKRTLRPSNPTPKVEKEVFGQWRRGKFIVDGSFISVDPG